jgi:hypothetical protein
MKKAMKDEAILATKGLVGWHVQGKSRFGGTYSTTLQELPQDVKHAVDMSEVYENDGVGVSVHKIWKRPNLDLSLPDNNVRNLFEGCIGHAGSTDGHPWDGSLASLNSSDSVGIDVYLKILIAAGGKVVR